MAEDEGYSPKEFIQEMLDSMLTVAAMHFNKEEVETNVFRYIGCDLNYDYTLTVERKLKEEE